MEILSQEQEQNQVQESIAEQYAEMVRSQDNFYWSQMLKHLRANRRTIPLVIGACDSAGFKSVAPPPERSDGHF
jgi:glutathionylspermidine synthase